ncbi:MAG: ABC transporter ATP-binding protein [Bacteroidota bacterium]|nr:ABC transporter ATP-binding protein [Bacteroidota bacterium]MDP4246228.1 ABC transporter ATP-binding protein [Bacteroidota bacterium]MDP4260606.1 ABC transporter ATP-binding protein [Bacteroidota bacterium]
MNPQARNYNLNAIAASAPKKPSTWASLKSLLALMSGDRPKLILAFLNIVVNSVLNLLSPLIIGLTIDHYITHRDFDGVLRNGAILLGIYGLAFATRYFQTTLMGGYGQRILFTLRNAIFNKLQELPVAFFNQNKAGDLISRVNNDTDRLNQFFSQSLMQFIGSIAIMTGAGIFLLAINLRLGIAAMIPAAVLWVFTKGVSPWVKRKNAANLKSVGGMSAEIQESLNNFKVIIAFNRRDYFRKRFDEANKTNYATAVSAGLANNLFTPVYGLLSNAGQLVVLAFGIFLIAKGFFTIGLLVSFLSYINNFYSPLQQLAALWANFQVALAGWDRISGILSMQSDLETLPALSALPPAGPHPAKPAALAPANIPAPAAGRAASNGSAAHLLEFRNVSFHYPDGKEVLHNNSFVLDRGKTYALVGPTGGGKTTTASIIARLYDPTSGTVFLDGRDIRSYVPAERTKKIGFILQEPFLFSGTIRENILYGNEQYSNYSNEQLAAVIHDANLETLLARFDKGLDTQVVSGGDGISLGQKQLIAFMRAVLRNPDLLILDEATANIDTVTEQLLETILKGLPDTTTRVIIAHRLNTIESADEIFFVNSGEITRAGSLDQAVDMLLHGKRVS